MKRQRITVRSEHGEPLPFACHISKKGQVELIQILILDLPQNEKTKTRRKNS